MNKMKKGIVTVALISALALTAVGCGKSGKTTKGTGNTTKANQTTQKGQTTKTQTTEKKVVETGFNVYINGKIYSEGNNKIVYSENYKNAITVKATYSDNTEKDVANFTITDNVPEVLEYGVYQAVISYGNYNPAKVNLVLSSHCQAVAKTAKYNGQIQTAEVDTTGLTDVELSCDAAMEVGTHFINVKGTDLLGAEVEFVIPWIIEKAELVVTPNLVETNYGVEPVYSGFEVSGFLGEDTIDMIDTSFVNVDFNYNSKLAVGSYKYSINGLDAESYTFKYNEGTYKINKAVVNAEDLDWDTDTLVYTGENLVPSFANDAYDLTYEFYKDNVKIDNIVTPGTYIVKATVNANANYELSGNIPDLELTVQKGKLNRDEIYFDYECYQIGYKAYNDANVYYVTGEKATEETKIKYINYLKAKHASDGVTFDVSGYENASNLGIEDFDSDDVYIYIDINGGELYEDETICVIIDYYAKTDVIEAVTIDGASVDFIEFLKKDLIYGKTYKFTVKDEYTLIINGNTYESGSEITFDSSKEKYDFYFYKDSMPSTYFTKYGIFFNEYSVDGKDFNLVDSNYIYALENANGTDHIIKLSHNFTSDDNAYFLVTTFDYNEKKIDIIGNEVAIPNNTYYANLYIGGNYKLCIDFDRFTPVESITATLYDIQTGKFIQKVFEYENDLYMGMYLEDNQILTNFKINYKEGYETTVNSKLSDVVNYTDLNRKYYEFYFNQTENCIVNNCLEISIFQSYLGLDGYSDTNILSRVKNNVLESYLGKENESIFVDGVQIDSINDFELTNPIEQHRFNYEIVINGKIYSYETTFVVIDSEQIANYISYMSVTGSMMGGNSYGYSSNYNYFSTGQNVTYSQMKEANDYVAKFTAKSGYKVASYELKNNGGFLYFEIVIKTTADEDVTTLYLVIEPKNGFTVNEEINIYEFFDVLDSEGTIVESYTKEEKTYYDITGDFEIEIDDASQITIYDEEDTLVASCFGSFNSREMNYLESDVYKVTVENSDGEIKTFYIDYNKMGMTTDFVTMIIGGEKYAISYVDKDIESNFRIGMESTGIVAYKYIDFADMIYEKNGKKYVTLDYLDIILSSTVTDKNGKNINLGVNVELEVFYDADNNPYISVYCYLMGYPCEVRVYLYKWQKTIPTFNENTLINGSYKETSTSEIAGFAFYYDKDNNQMFYYNSETNYGKIVMEDGKAKLYEKEAIEATSEFDSLEDAIITIDGAKYLYFTYLYVEEDDNLILDTSDSHIAGQEVDSYLFSRNNLLEGTVDFNDNNVCFKYTIEEGTIGPYSFEVLSYEETTTTYSDFATTISTKIDEL